MGCFSLLRAGHLMKTAAFAVGVSVAVSATLVPPAKAASEDNSLFNKRRLEKAVASGQVPPSASAGSGHTAGSGIKATTATAIVTDGSISPFITPDSPAAIQAVADKYAAIVANGGWPKVPSGKLSKGDTGKQAEALNKRLFVEGYLRAEATSGEYAAVFTSATEDALKRFQRNHGLAMTGAIDGGTLAALNVPAEKRLATIRANIPRLAEYSKDLGPRYVVVNVPAQQIETISDGRVYSLHNAIVGRPSRPTPVVMTPLATVRFNPYWNAPPSIVERDILPRMMSKGPSKIMREMNMKIFNGVGGPEVDPDSVNWRSAVVDNYHFRQEPGGSNAMATAKIEFNSPFGIYLHDTPEPHLFQTANRFYSSGCVRVDKVAILINWILQGQDGIDQAKIADLAETKERLDTTIANPPQLRVAYLTAWPTAEGVAAFRPDVYELDGTGFIVGQPLPVGETEAGQRFVLKPIPRSPDAVDADEAFGFASLFRSRNDEKNNTGRPTLTKTADDSLVKVGDAKKTKTAAAKTAATKTKAAAVGAKRRVNPEKGSVMVGSDETPAKDKTAARKKLAKALKAGDKTKAAAADTKTKTKTDTKTAALAKKKPAATADTKATGKKPAEVKAADAKAAPSKADAKAKAPAAKKPAAECKAGNDGKLPDGCKTAAAVPAKKPVKAGTATAAN